MRTRCPACNTVFRVTSEQLRAKAGKVRCGYCQSIFNAFDGLVDDTPATSAPTLEESPEPAGSTVATQLDGSVEIDEAGQEEKVSEPAPMPEAEAEAEAEPRPVPDFGGASETETEAGAENVANAEAVPGEADELLVDVDSTDATSPEPAEIALSDTSTATDGEKPAPVADEKPETSAESTEAAREAGLVAPRELAEAPAYNRWAAGALTGDSSGGFDSEPARRSTWPFVVAALLLLGVLSGQLAYYFRSELVRYIPATEGIFDALEIAVPLSAQSDLVSIEASDLQSDTARGLFVLQATLRNQAVYAQAWPALELTLIDTQDAVVARRVLLAADYLPAGSDLTAFPANAETPVRLWIDAKGLGAAGYRLYIFYP